MESKVAVDKGQKRDSSHNFRGFKSALQCAKSFDGILAD